MATSRVLAVAAVALLLSATAAAAQQVSEKTNRDRKVLTAAEIEQAQVRSAYEAIEKLRPEYLRRVGRTQTVGPVPTAAVFVDGTDMGSLEELRRIQAGQVDEIHYLTGPDSEMKYGPRFSAGVIEVKLKH